MASTTAPSRRLGAIGSIIGVLALIAAVLPHWVVPVVFPPQPADQVIYDVGSRLKDRLIARAKGVEYHAPRPEKSVGHRWEDTFSIGALSLGLLAILLAVLSLIFREDKLLAGVSAALGVGAIAFEFSFIVMGVLCFIIIVYAVAQFIDLF